MHDAIPTRTSQLTFLLLTLRRHHPRKVPLTVSSPLHLIPPHALQVPQTPLPHRHREVPTLTHDINQLRRRHNVRLDLIPRLRPLLVRVGVSDEAGFAPGGADEAETESVARLSMQNSRARGVRKDTYGMLGPVSTNVPRMFRITVSLAG